MAYDFSTVHDRRETNSLKWNNMLPGTPQAIPLWVADMDFAAPPAVTKALAERIKHPIFGYTNLPADYLEAVASWNTRRYGRSWESRHFLAAPSVLHAMSMAVRTFTQPGDRILNLPPVYFPFFKLAQLNGREIFDVPLVNQGRWEMDFDAMERALSLAQNEGKPVKALLLSAPHNPTGRVWTRSELSTLGELSRRHEFLILSDEIHADLVLEGHRHLSPLDLPELADRTVVFAGPNKTFNLAGLSISHVVALDDGLRNKMRKAIEADFFDQPNVLSLTAAWAAYREGEGWLDELLVVIQENMSLLKVFLADLNREWKLEPVLTAAELEATYLAWVDVTGLIQRAGFSDDKDLGLFLEKNRQGQNDNGQYFSDRGQEPLEVQLGNAKSAAERRAGEDSHSPRELHRVKIGNFIVDHIVYINR